MTITIDAVIAGLIVSMLMASLVGFGALMAVMWHSTNSRLRTLGHEDRDIRGQLNGVLEMMIEGNKTREAHYESVLEAMQKSISLMAHVYTSHGNRDIPGA
jgi:hypothetical protein